MIARCPHCGKKLKINDKLTGKRGASPACKKPFAIPPVPAKPPQGQKPAKTPPPPPAPLSQSANIAQPAPPTTPPKATDSYQQSQTLLELKAKLKQLQELKNEGLISNGDFETKKKEILDKIMEV